MPPGCEKVIVEDIDKNPGIAPDPGRDARLALPDERMCIGEGVHLAMEQDPFPDRGLEVVPDPSLDEIPHEAADARVRIAVREVEMGQVIHLARMPACRYGCSPGRAYSISGCMVLTAFGFTATHHALADERTARLGNNRVLTFLMVIIVEVNHDPVAGMAKLVRPAGI